MAIKTTLLGTHFGTYRVQSDADQVLDVRGHETDPDPSPIGEALSEYQMCRVQRPAVRKSWLEHGPGPAVGPPGQPGKRGSEPFVEVSWETVLDLVAVELERVRTTHGNQSIFAGSYGWGAAGRFHAPSAQLHRFANLFGGYTAQKGTYSSAAAEAILPYIFGMTFHQVVAQQTAWSVIADHTELFVSFGGMRTSNTDVAYGGQGAHHTREWLFKASENGMKLLSVSPLADDVVGSIPPTTRPPAWLSLRPGTDVALMLALMHELVVSGRADEEFLDKYCEGWPVLREYLLAEPFDAAWAAEITDIDATQITALAHEMADKRTLVNVTLSLQRADHGEQSYWAATALACVLGQIGLPGGGMAAAFFTAGNTGSGQARKRIAGLPVPPHKSGMPVIGVSRIAELLEGAGREYDFGGRTSTFPDTRLVYWCGGNPFHHHQDLNRLRAAWQLPDTVIVHEPFWTPVAKHADIVLPATTQLERSDIVSADQHLVYQRAAVEPYAEARDDHWIFCQLAERLGFRSQFSEDRSVDEWLEALYAIFTAENPALPPFEEFKASEHWRHSDVADMGDTDQVFLADFRAGAELRTPSGKIELFSQQLADLGYEDCGPHPAWFEPYERLGAADSGAMGSGAEGSDAMGNTAASSKLHLISNQPRTRLHSQYDFASPSQATKHSGREPIRLHPTTAAERGIAQGDVVRVFNSRGACLAAAVLDDTIRADVCQLSTGAWYDPDEDGTCRAGNPNVLTRDKGTSRLGQGPTPHTCLVEIEKLETAPPPVRAYDPPQFVSAADHA